MNSSSNDDSKNGYYVLMSLSLCVLFIRYNMATFLSSFFPNYAEDVNITSTSSGAIFSAYPIGMFLTVRNFRIFYSPKSSNTFAYYEYSYM